MTRKSLTLDDLKEALRTATETAIATAGFLVNSC